MTSEVGLRPTPSLPWSGGCQCGLVRYQVLRMPLTLYACHCTQCQAQSASAFGLSMRVEHEALQVVGDTSVFVRDQGLPTEVECHFCPTCGTRLYHQRPGAVAVSLKAGSLDSTAWLRPVGHIWLASKQVWFEPETELLLYERQPESYEELIRAWRRRMGEN